MFARPGAKVAFLPVCVLTSIFIGCAEGQPVDLTGGSGGSGTTSASTGGAGASSSASMSSVSSTGTQGTGGAAMCGNGTVDAGEECDDANAAAGDGCDGCTVECSGVGEKEDPTNHHCFRLDGTGLGWAAAEAACASWSPLAHLASIRNDTELGLVLDLVTTESWIGATDIAVEGTFAWSDGEPFDFDSWATGEPNDGGTEDCVAFRASGLWGDTVCSAAKPFVCERVPAGLP